MDADKIIDGTTLRLTMHRWKVAPGKSTHVYLQSLCGRMLERAEDVQPILATDKRCKKCYPPHGGGTSE